uniref:Uncharacterized protein n=1 Tax=Oryza barthii TaxID=65489 RepID=A0A0D3HCW8_9ORYZ
MDGRINSLLSTIPQDFTSMSARASNHAYICSDDSQMPYYNNSVPSGGNGRFYITQNHQDAHYASSDDGSQKIGSSPQAFEAPYCTLESSSANGAHPAHSSASSHSISPISGSPLSHHDSHSDHTYNSPPSASCVTEITDLQIKLRELENAILGPELDIAYDSPESALQPNIMATPENWRQLLGINTGDLKQVIIACGKAVAENDVRLTELLISELVIVVNFAYQLHHTPDESVSTENHRDRILRMVKSLSPRLVTLVEQESNTNTRPFFPRYLETLDYYTAMFESIDVALPRDDKRRMSAEQHCVARDIVNLIACEGAERVERHEVFGKWKARLTMAGFRPYPLSSVVNSTIKTLLHTYNSFYRLEERDGVLYLGWKNRVLVVSSAWC